MSASTGALARLVEQATPGPRAKDEKNARLLALAPDAVRLLTDMAHSLEWIVNAYDLIEADDAHIEAELDKVGPLLARFAALEQEAAQ